MLKCIKELVKARDSKTIGNHGVRGCLFSVAHIYNETTRKHEEVASTRKFTYHGHTICVVDDRTKKFYLSHAGWWTSSTKRALASYRALFEDLGYENVWNNPIYNYECK